MIISWVHCNSCYFYYDSSDRFYLLNCMHVFCVACLQEKVLPKANKCCFCNRVVRFKKIDQTLDPKLLAALDPDPSKDFESVVRSLELNIRQMTHLHKGIEKAEKEEAHYDHLEQRLDQETSKMQTMTKKVMAQNHMLHKMLLQEDEKKKQSNSVSRRFRPDILAGSQNIQSQSTAVMGPPRMVPKYTGHQFFGNAKPNVTRLSSISGHGRSFN